MSIVSVVDVERKLLELANHQQISFLWHSAFMREISVKRKIAFLIWYYPLSYDVGMKDKKINNLRVLLTTQHLFMSGFDVEMN